MNPVDYRCRLANVLAQVGVLQKKRSQIINSNDKREICGREDHVLGRQAENPFANGLHARVDS